MHETLSGATRHSRAPHPADAGCMAGWRASLLPRRAGLTFYVGGASDLGLADELGETILDIGMAWGDVCRGNYRARAVDMGYFLRDHFLVAHSTVAYNVRSWS